MGRCRAVAGWRRRAAWAVALLVFAGSGCARSPARGAADSATVPVRRVVDGDTIHVLFGGRDERVRLIGVDTPEVSWYGHRGECFGAEAGRYAQRRLSGRRVRLAFDAAARDRFGRLLAYVYLGPELFNLTLVRLGYARADPVPPDTRMAGTFAAAERAARSARVGLWDACVLTPGGP